MSLDFQKLRSIFEQAVVLDQVEWPGLLDGLCGQDAELRRGVEELLEAHANGGSVLDNGPLPTIDRPVAERPGTQIGPYKLLQQIGEGGMGVVYLAEQLEPVKRRVALKIIKPGMDTRQVIARFEAERQALSLMDHPNIAKVLDAGEVGPVCRTEPESPSNFAMLGPARQAGSTGRPYFVMELVKGQPITQYCDEHHLTPRQRLELLLPVCQAIQHAHQKGIIHRDLKPTNILVAEYDNQPVPKVIDFGVAKATAASLTEKTMFTGQGQIVGTLEYMSPEQAKLNQLDIDTRSDIYSLGVLLYELLTGSTPFNQARLRTLAFDETLRIIREEEPEKPSTRLSDSGEALASISANRHTEPARLTRLVRGELDWIVMKCLEKDRNRRYETASGLAADVQRYLDDEPVQACPPSAAYRLQKFLRRNKNGVLIAALTLCFLAVLVGGGAWLAGERSRRQTRLNQQVAAAVQEAALHGEQALTLIDAPHQWEATLAMASSALKWADAVAGNDAELLDSELRVEIQQLSARLKTDELDRRMVATIERVRLEISEPNIVTSQFTESEAPPKYRQAFASYGLVATTTPTAEAAALLAGKHPAIRDALFTGLYDWLSFEPGRQEQTWLKSVLAAADDDPWRNQLRAARQRADYAALEALADRPEAVSQPPATLVILASTLRAIQAHDSAIRLLRRAQERYPADFWINHSLARVLLLGAQPPRAAEAVTYYRIAIALRPQNAGAYLNLGAALKDAGDLPGAIGAVQKAIQIEPQYGRAHYNLGIALNSTGDLDGAIDSYQRAIEVQPDYAPAYYNLGNALNAKGDLAGAIAAYQKAVAIKPDYAEVHFNLGLALQANGDPPGAIAAYLKAAQAQPDNASAHYNLGSLLSDKGDLAGAADAYQRAITFKADHAAAHCNLGQTLKLQGEFRAALVALRRGHELGSQTAGWTYPSATWVAECERLVELDDKFPAVLEGKQQPADAAVGIELAGLCAKRGLHLAAVRHYEESFRAKPELARRRYILLAACSAAMAGCRRGKDSGQLDEQESARWREQAIAWLRVDLDAWFGKLTDKSQPFRNSVRVTLEYMKRHPDLAGLRDATALEELPEMERAACQKLWADVEAILAQAAKSNP